MAEEKSDHITILADRQPTSDAYSRTLNKTASKDRDTESAYDEGFDRPRDSDFRRKQVFKGWKLLLLAYQSTGIIYGDIGTSPLYVYSSTFKEPPSYNDLLGALSLIIWTLTITVTIKYVCIVLNADNEGQGGTFAMYSLLTRFGNIATGVDPDKENMIRFERHKTNDMKSGNKNIRGFLEHHNVARVVLGGIAIFGVCLIISDGILTPAQSVLGAIQGLTVVRPDLSLGAIVGITCAIIVLLYLIQPLGVARLGSVFAPVVIVWLLLNFSFGVYNLTVHDHTVLRAFSPYFAGLYFVRNKTEGWRSLGGILLAFTGVEALFADLGAFSKGAIQISWLGLAYPCLLMAYIGQAAFISVHPDAFSNPFFRAAPPGTFWPALIISILAAIVASQALITSTFQLLFQLINMSYFPPIKMVNTSQKYHSQVYIPMANWMMMVGTVVVTAVFKDTTKLGNAYGVCVILDTVITTLLVSLVALIVWRIKWYFVLPLWLTFSTFEGLYLSSALEKIPKGGWFTVTLAVFLSIIFSTWRYGKEHQWRGERRGRLPRLSKLVVKDEDGTLKLTQRFGSGEITGMKGLGIFFDKAGGDFVPLIYQEFLTKFEAQPEIQVFLHIKATTVPFVSYDEKYAITRTGLPNCYRMVIRYGYSESPITVQLGGVVYNEVRKYIIHELNSGGLSSSIEPGVISGVSAEAITSSDSLPFEPSSSTLTKRKETSTDAVLLPNETSISDSDRARRLRALDNANRAQVMYIVGKEDLKMPENVYNIFRRTILGAFLWMRDSTTEKVTSMEIPYEKLIEIGFIREV